MFLKKLLVRRRLRLYLLILGIVVALMGFEEVADDVFHDPLEGDVEAQALDQSISKYVASFRSDHLNQSMIDLTALGSVSVIVTLFLIFASILFSYRDFKGVGFISAVLLGGGLWPHFLKQYFERERPIQSEWLVQVGSSSFPSGHSFGAAAAYIGFAYYASLYARGWPHEVFFYFLGALLALLVGVSRIFLGVHYPTDVLAGLSGGVAWALTACAVYEALMRTKRDTIRLN